MKIEPYAYSVLCDTYRCNNFARYSLGKAGEPMSTRHNICERCLSDIVKEAPIDMALSREDVKEHYSALYDPELQEKHDALLADYAALKEQVKQQSESDLYRLTLNELREVGKIRKVPNYSSSNKDTIIAALLK